MWLKNTRGERDAIFTLGIVAFGVVTLRLLAGVFGGFELFGKSFIFQDMDSGNIAAYLGATLGAYVARRYTKDVAAKEEEAMRKGK